jgi:CRP-like cAMP-binding protein
MKEFLEQRLDAARDLYLLALALGERSEQQFGALIQEARLHFITVIEEARLAGLDTLDIQNILASHDLSLEHAIRPEMRERLDELLRMHANPR